MSDCRAALLLVISLAVMTGSALAGVAPPLRGNRLGSRKVVEVKQGNGTIFLLTLPTLYELPDNASAGFVRTYSDTCGLFDILLTKYGMSGGGPPPHIHYADDEWFVQAGPGKVRIFTHQKATTFIPGMLPGFNAPPVKVGSAVISTGDVLYSPRGSLHYFARETDGEDFYAIHASGYAMQLVYSAFSATQDPEKLLYYTGLYGAPHDLTGRFVGMDKCGEKCYLKATGPVDVGPPELERLQKLFDDAEKCLSPAQRPAR